MLSAHQTKRIVTFYCWCRTPDQGGRDYVPLIYRVSGMYIHQVTWRATPSDQRHQCPGVETACIAQLQHTRQRLNLSKLPRHWRTRWYECLVGLTTEIIWMSLSAEAAARMVAPARSSGRILCSRTGSGSLPFSTLHTRHHVGPPPPL